MNKRLATRLALLAAAAAAATTASAQSTVTIYGVADAYLQVGKTNDTTFQLQSGGLSGSRLGFKGSEDLGGGLKAIFQIEHGFAIDTASTTQGGVFWGRQAFVGLSSANAGTLTVGRQYTPQFITVDAFDPFSTGYGSVASSGIVSLVAVRANNSAVYNSPKFGPFTFSLLGALGEGTTGKTYNADAQYNDGNFGVGLDWIRHDGLGAQEDLTMGLITASYDFKVAKIMGGFQAVKNATQALNVADDRREFFGGVQVPVGPGIISVGAGQGKYKDISGTKATQYSASYDHFLSKRTDVYVAGTYINQGDLTGYTADAATGAGPVVTSAGQNVKALAVGIRHRF